MRFTLIVLAILAFFTFSAHAHTLTPATFHSIVARSAISVPPSGFTEGISESPDGVTIHFRNQTLETVLQKIAEQTGIEFNLNYQVSETPIQVDILAQDWRQAINALLGTQSRLEFWTGDPATSKFWLMEGSLYDVESVKELKKREETDPSAEKSAKQNKVPAEASQKTLSLLPPHILFDPGLLLYLKSVGIGLPIEFETRFEPVLEGLPEDYPISQLVLSSPQFLEFVEYLKSIGLEPPQS